MRVKIRSTTHTCGDGLKASFDISIGRKFLPEPFERERTIQGEPDTLLFRLA
jgi:hypothetical protein